MTLVWALSGAWQWMRGLGQREEARRALMIAGYAWMGLASFNSASDLDRADTPRAPWPSWAWGASARPRPSSPTANLPGSVISAPPLPPGAVLLLLLAACAREDRTSLYRRPISPTPASGWARLPLDAEAQRQLKDAWIGDVEGRSIPFIEAREGRGNHERYPWRSSYGQGHRRSTHGVLLAEVARGRRWASGNP